MRHFLRFSFACLALATACAPAPGGGGETGTVGLALQIAPGVSVDSASYQITGPDAFTSSGTVSVGDSADVPVPLSGIPVGSGYTITVSATASDGITICKGLSAFAIADTGPSTVVVHLMCNQGTAGSVQVNGTINVCPVLEGISAIPGEVLVGHSLALTAAAHDADSGPSPLHYTWVSAMAGTLSGGSSPQQTFTCRVPGTPMVMLAVSDGDPDPTCGQHLAITVRCTAP